MRFPEPCAAMSRRLPDDSGKRVFLSGCGGTSNLNGRLKVSLEDRVVRRLTSLDRHLLRPLLATQSLREVIHEVAAAGRMGTFFRVIPLFNLDGSAIEYEDHDAVRCCSCLRSLVDRSRSEKGAVGWFLTGSG